MAPSEVFAPDCSAARVALVTGGGTGLGKAAAAELAACGARVFVAGRRAEVVQAAAEELGGEWAPATCARPRMPRGWSIQRSSGSAASMFSSTTPADSTSRRRRRSRRRAGGRSCGSTSAGSWRCRRLRTRERSGGRSRHDRQRHALAASRAYRDGPLERGARRGRGRHARARGPLGGRRSRSSRPAAGHFKTDALQKYPEAVREGAARTVPLQRLGRPEEHAWLIALLASPLGRSPQRLDRDPRRRPRQLVRALAAAEPGGRVGRGADRGAPPGAALDSALRAGVV